MASALIRRTREGALTSRQRDRSLTKLRADVAVLAVVELTPEIVVTATRLLQRYQLRAGDAIQLASALYLHRELGVSVPFVVFDDRLINAARSEGLAVEPVRRVTQRRRSMSRDGRTR